ncbi:MAG: hypothetical protein JEZ09_17440 [Salinivirgaceae bacterium]|nr:hypothetical protein [Salinivirgaceae bacterium]
MKKIYIILLLSISFSAFAQRTYKVMEKNVFTAIDSHSQSEIDSELDDAREQFKKALSKDKTDNIANFGLSVVYSFDAYSKKDYFEAWKYFQIAEENIASFNEDDRPVLDQYFFKVDKRRRNKPLNKNMEWERKNVEDKLIKYVREENNLEIANRFLNEFPDSRYHENVVHIRNYIEYRTAENANTVEAFNAFLKKYPTSAQVKVATANRNRIAYKQAVASNSLTALKGFVKMYPAALQVEDAKKLMGVFAYNEAVQKNTLAAIEQFMIDYPNSSKMPEAKIVKRKLLFEWAKSVNTLDAYNQFVAQYPEGEMYIDIFNLKASALGEQLLIDFPMENYSFIKGFDNNKINDFGGDIAIRPNGEILLVGNSKKAADEMNDVWMLGLSAEGKMNWNTIIGNQYDDLANKVYINNKNEIFVAGSTNAMGDSIPGKSWIFKLNPEGKNIYNRTLEGQEIHSFQIYPDGKAIICGTAYNYTDSTNYTFLERVNENGRKLWDRTYSQSGYLGAVVINNVNTAFVAGERWLFAIGEQGYLKWDKIIEDSAVNINSVKITGDNKVVYSGTKGNEMYALAFDFAGNKLWETTFERVDLAKVKESCILSDNSILIASETIDKKIVIAKISNTGTFVSNKVFSLANGVALNGIEALANNFALVSATRLGQQDLIVFKLNF